MKGLLIIIFILSASITISQTQMIDSITADVIALNSDWKFHAGDNPEWSKPDLDDS